MRMIFSAMRRWARRWYSRELYLLRCERCGTVRGAHEHVLPDTGQIACPTCAMKTYHTRVYYDHEDRRFRELGGMPTGTRPYKDA